MPKQQSLPGILAAACAVIISLAAEFAHAAGAAQVSESPVDRMIALNKQAFVDIQSQHLQAAKYWLDEALVISETAGLEHDEMTARTYVHLAAVALAGPRDRDEALRYFDLALRINPNIAVTPGLEVAGLRSAYLQARQQAGLPPNPDPTAPNFDPSLTGSGSLDMNEVRREESRIPAASDQPASATPQDNRTLPAPVREAYAAALLKEPDLPARVPVPLYCPLPLDLLPGQDLVVRCLTQRHTRKSSASFHYRPDGQHTPFAELPMDRSPKGWLVAVLPARQLEGKALTYYITAQLPNTEQPLYLAYPEAPRALTVRTEVAGEGTEATVTQTHPQATSPSGMGQPQRRTVGSLWFAVAGGSGVVYHGEETVDSNARIQGTNKPAPVREGFSPASLLQLEPELGYQATRRLSVSILGRYQYAPKEGKGSTPAEGEKEVLTSAFAIFAQARLSFLTVGNFQTYASGGAGFGRSFLAVIDRDCAAGTCSLEQSDTLHGGAAALTAALGVFYHLNPRLGVFAEAKEIASLPKFMALTELNLGLAVATPLGSSNGERMTVANHGSQP